MARDRQAPTLTLACPAKVNLALAVEPAGTEHRGYHRIASWMIAIDFTDRLTLQRLPDDTPSDYHTVFAADAPAPQRIDWALDDDLAVRAHRLVERHSGRFLPIALRVDKRIPAGSGLAGGSADAAGTLVGLNRLFDLKLGGPALGDLAAELGCDTAFAVAALAGNVSSARVTGVGEKLEPLTLGNPIHLAIVLPPFTCPTAGVYRRFDQLPAHRPFARQARRAEDLARQGNALGDAEGVSPSGSGGALFNDLEPAAAATQPRLSALLTTLRDDLELPAHLTGSGSAVFVVAPSAQGARDHARAISRHTALPVVTARSVPPSPAASPVRAPADMPAPPPAAGA